MNKKTIYNWLCNILNKYDNKEVESISKNYVNDNIGLLYLIDKYKNDKENFERDFLFNYKRVKSIDIEKDYFMILRPKIIK